MLLPATQTLELAPSACLDRTSAPQPSVRRSSARLPAAARRFQGMLRLWNGRCVYVRPIRSSDGKRLSAFARNLSISSSTFRFFVYHPKLPPDELWRLTHVDYHNRMALVVTAPVPDALPKSTDRSNELIIAVGRYDCDGGRMPSEVEVAFTVADAWQQQGIGTALLLLLANYARLQGITTFLAHVMPENARMLEVLDNAGFPVTKRYQDGVLDVVVDITQPATDSFVAPRFQPDEQTSHGLPALPS